MIRWLTVETYCFVILVASVALALAAWISGMLRKSFGALPAALWIALIIIALGCTAIIAMIQFTGAR